MALMIDRLERALMAAYVTGVSTELESEPGIGKSSVIKQLCKSMAKKLGQPFGLAVRHLSTMDPTEVAGPMFITKRPVLGEMTESAVNSYPAVFPSVTDTVFLPDGTTTKIGKHGSIPKFGYIFLDEFRQAPHDVQKPAARLLDEHCIGEWSLDMFGGRWGVVAASNRAEDRSGANKELAFITNRKLVLAVQSNAPVLANYLEDKNELHPILIGYVRAFPGSVFTPVVPKDDKPFPTPRSFERAGKMLMAMGNDGIPASDPEATEVACGLIGAGRGPELIGYIRRHDEMPTLDDIIKNPKTTPVPDRADVQWAVTQMLIGAVDHHKNKILELFTYLQRLGREMQLVGVSGISRKTPDITYNQAYVTWAKDNRELLMAAFAADRRYKKQ